jgi:hypothetical protein
MLSMAEKNDQANDKNADQTRRAAKKLYQQPAFRHERVFETMALSCGKINATELQSRFNRHSS